MSWKPIPLQKLGRSYLPLEFVVDAPNPRSVNKGLYFENAIINPHFNPNMPLGNLFDCEVCVYSYESPVLISS